MEKDGLAAFAFFLFNTCLNELNVQEKSQKLYVVESGTVTEKGRGETLPGVNVFCDSINVAVSSNNYGFCSLHIPTGRHRLRCSFVGFQTIDTIIQLHSNLVMNIGMSEGIVLKGVLIHAESQRRVSEESSMSSIRIPCSADKRYSSLIGLERCS